MRESGMPEEAYWESFFDPPAVLRAFGLSGGDGEVVEFGCGYGTFTLPAARLTTAAVHALDVEPSMTARAAERARAEGLANVRSEVRDFVRRGTGRPDGSAGVVLLFNILHHEEPGVLLREALRVLRPGGRAAVMHWNPDPATPRGPPMEIRPRPQECAAWARAAGFELGAELDLPPYHYGLVLVRP